MDPARASSLAWHRTSAMAMRPSASVLTTRTRLPAREGMMNTKTDSGIDYSTRMPARERMISSATYPSLPVLLRTMAMRPTNLTPGG